MHSTKAKLIGWLYGPSLSPPPPTHIPIRQSKLKHYKINNTTSKEEKNDYRRMVICLEQTALGLWTKKMPSRDNNSRKCFTKAWRHGLWASACHLFQFFEWFYQFIAWNGNDNKTNTKPIEPGTNDCDCRYETIILISVSAYNQSQATATDPLNDKINLNFPQNYQLHDFSDLFRLVIVGFCFAK